jgi:type III restriction enzyme
MTNPFFDQPIPNSPDEYLARHWELDDQGQPTQRMLESRRRAEFITPIPQPRNRKGSAAQQPIVFDEGQGLSIQAQQYDHTAPGGGGGNRHLAYRSRPARRTIGARVLDHLMNANHAANPGLMRLALKMATGAGKTTVMAMLIAWHTINAVRRPDSPKFMRGFLIVAPGLTVRDRLRVLQPHDPDSYYASHELIPSDMLGDLKCAKLVITNYHAFRRRERLELSKGGRALLQGRG